MEAEEELKTLPNDSETDKRFFLLIERITHDAEHARRTTRKRIENRKWAETEGNGW